jgi:hypothetical protein
MAVERYERDFNTLVIRLGIATMTAGIVANFLPPVYVWLVYGAIPPFGDIVKIAVLATTAFGASWVVQLISYFPVLGMPGTYVSFLVGSVAEIRLPASAMAQRVTEVEQGTREAEVISTIAIAGSVLMSAFIITLFTFIGSAVVPVLPKLIQKSFDYILPAVFAAVLLELSRKYLKVGLTTLAFAVAFSFVGKALAMPGWLWSLCIISGGVVIARFFYLQEQRSGTAK